MKIETVDNKDGTVDVTYHPTAPGEYLVHVSFNQKPVPGVPFKPKIASKIDVSGIKVEGLDSCEYSELNVQFPAKLDREILQLCQLIPVSKSRFHRLIRKLRPWK